jgi:predicted YcjX-like family ATPase
MVDTSGTPTASRSIAPRLRRAIRIGVTALSATVALTGMIAMLAPTGASRPPTRSQPRHNTLDHAPRTSRLSAADWITVKNVIRLRTMALAPGRTALYRSFAAYMGLSGLISLHPILPGRRLLPI